jgi:hypothetical protein
MRGSFLKYIICKTLPILMLTVKIAFKKLKIPVSVLKNRHRE